MMSAFITHTNTHYSENKKRRYTAILDEIFLKDELTSLPENKPKDKTLFYRYSKK